jgi:DNA replication protein DnaC
VPFQSSPGLRVREKAVWGNELVEAKHQLQLRRVMTRWSRYDLIAIDEIGYVPLAEVGAEFLFQVVAERAEKAAVVLTTNLPFSEWTSGRRSSRTRDSAKRC